MPLFLIVFKENLIRAVIMLKHKSVDCGIDWKDPLQLYTYTGIGTYLHKVWYKSIKLISCHPWLSDGSDGNDQINSSDESDCRDSSDESYGSDVSDESFESDGSDGGDGSDESDGSNSSD